MFKIYHRYSQISFLDLPHNYHENSFNSLQSQLEFQIPRTNITLKGTESVGYSGLAI